MSNTHPTAVISLVDVGVIYKKGRSLFSKGRHEVFHGLSFDIYEGESLGIVGRNGAGKSTLLRLLAGVISPDSGRVISRGVSSALLALGAGFNHQLTGRTNIMLNAMLLGFDKAEIEEKQDEIIAYTELGSAIDDTVKTYSAGMSARLAFAIAIHMKPDVLLIDESLGVGDAAFMQKSSETLHSMVNSNQTVVLVSHQADTIRSLCDRVIWIEEGLIRGVGLADEIVAQYEDYITSIHTDST